MNTSLDIRNQTELQNALLLAQHTVYKRYLPQLQTYPLVEPGKALLDEQPEDCIRMLQLEEFSCKKDEDIFQKLSTVYHASMSLGCHLIVMIDVNRINAPARIYIGVRNADRMDQESKRNLSISFRTLQNGLQSNFPGSKLSVIPSREKLPQLIQDIFGESAKYVSAVSCVASIRDKTKTEKKGFVQGLEKFVDAMRGHTYTAIFIAEPIDENEQAVIRNGYESLYSTLSSFQKSVWSYNENESKAVMESLSTGISKAVTEGTSQTQTHTINGGVSLGIGGGINSAQTVSNGTTHTGPSAVSKALNLANLIGTVASIIPGGQAVGMAIGAVTAIGGALAGGSTDGVTDGISNMIGKSLGINGGMNIGYSNARANTTSHSETETTSETRTDSRTETKGRGRTLQIENINKPIAELLERIEEQLQRVQEGEDYGAYSCGAYFLSGKQESNLLAANTYRALMIGEGSSVESGAINVWSVQKDSPEESRKVEFIKEYLKHFVHPVFAVLANAPTEEDAAFITYTPTTVVSGLELPLHLGLPTKSVYGLPVIEHAEFGRNVTYKDKRIQEQKTIRIGSIYHMGQIEKKSEESEVALDVENFTSHTFVTGSTGAGKSNAIYQMMDMLNRQDVKTLVIEPAKGEYKQIFGDKVNVYGTNPAYTELFRINPFQFEPGIHVLEHIDRLIDIFNVCWPMYAAMPAVLKEAVELAYISAGWNLDTSVNKYADAIYPCFEDVLIALRKVISSSDYSQEVKDNYTGSLITRIKSLTNGLNGQIFSGNEIDNKNLFEENTIIDLSRVGSSETKSMIMGILIMRLQERRMSQGGINLPLRHVTVLEEAHNLLKRTSMEQSSESSNLAGKSVEMISNAIAEMRTYGEGFIIADQAPGLLDLSAIRNTNTKIIMRLPDLSDRELVGRSAGLTDDQIEELTKLPSGVAAVYQNKWIEPVLCKVDYYEAEPTEYKKPGLRGKIMSEKELRERLVQYILSDISKEEPETDVETLKKYLLSSNISASLKVELLELLGKNKPQKLKEVYELVTECLGNTDTVFARSLHAENIEDWNRLLLREMDFEMRDLSRICQDNILECMIHQKSIEMASGREQFLAWMTSMGRKIM